MTNIRKWLTPLTALLGAILGTALIFIRAYSRDPSARHDAIFARSWWAWWDQGWYYKDVMAWASWNLNPALHFYFSGYALIAAPFVHITPLNPFAVPDFASVLATAWLLARLARYLAPDRPFMPALAAWAFFAILAFREEALRVWIDPWDTTPTVPLCLWALQAALQFHEEPRARRAFVAGLAAGLISAFRPTEAMIFGGASAAYCLVTLARLPRGVWAANAAAGACGALLGAAPGVIAYVAIHGFRASDYVIMSRNFGFEFRLVAFQWVTIMLAPGPVLAPGYGLIPAYPWMLTGLAGLIAGIAGARAKGSLHAYLLVGGAVVTHLVVILSYRGLQSVGLFRYENQHYFKIDSVCLAVFTILLLDGAMRSARARVACFAALVCVSCLLPWRVGFSPDAAASFNIQGNRILLPHGVGGIGYAVLVRGDARQISFENSGLVLKIGGQIMRPRYDFQDVPTPDGLAVRPERDLPHMPAEIDLPPGMSIAVTDTPISAGWLRVHFAL